jgi:hypothetical protein
MDDGAFSCGRVIHQDKPESGIGEEREGLRMGDAQRLKALLMYVRGRHR